MKYQDWQNSYKLIPIVTIALIALCTVASATDGGLLGPGGEVGTELISWQLIVILAVVVSFSIVVVGFIVTHAFEMQQLNTMFRNELMQVVFTAIGIALLFVLLAILETQIMPAIAEEYGYSDPITLQKASEITLQHKLNAMEMRFNGLIDYTDEADFDEILASL